MIPLIPDRYARALPILDAIPTNTLLARMILLGLSPGAVYVDAEEAPAAALFCHDTGLNFLFGPPQDPAFSQDLVRHFLLQPASKARYLMVYPPEWSRTLEELAGIPVVPALSADPSPSAGALVRDSRLNFRFASGDMPEEPSLPSSEYQLIPIGRTLFDFLRGTVVPSLYWKDYDTFAAHGHGYCLCKGIEIASFCFCSARIESRFELGVETVPAFRGRGLAVHACHALLRHCLAKDLEPVWGCRGTNAASAALARKLGFEVVEELPYYRLLME